MLSKDRVRNIVLLGATGNGKSSTGNTLSGRVPPPFIVGDDLSSCANSMDEYVCQKKGIRIIDMIGFGDTNYSEKHVDKIIRQITIMMSNPRVESTNQIDAFLVVCKLNPRPQSLKNDLERVKELFGTAAFKSMIIVVISPSKKTTTSEFLQQFRKMDDLVRIIKEGKKEDPNENWFCVWDNKEPLMGQEEELMEKIGKLQPYTHKEFLLAEEEIRRKIDEKTEGELSRRIAHIKREYENDKVMRERKMQEAEQAYRVEREQLMKARDRALMEVEKLFTGLNEMKEENRREMEKLFEEMNREREDNFKKMTEIMLKNQADSMKRIEEMQTANQKLMMAYSEQIHKLIENSSPKNIGGGPEKSDNFFGGFDIGKILTTVGMTAIQGLTKSKCNIF